MTDNESLCHVSPEMSRKKSSDDAVLTSVIRLRERHSHVLTDAAKIDAVELLARHYQALVRATIASY